MSSSRPPRALGALAFGLTLTSIPLGCGTGENAAGLIAKAPAYEPGGQAKCGVIKSRSRPLIVEWPPGDRLALESQMKRGLVAVRYEGCEMEVLRQCHADGAYSYSATTAQTDNVSIKNGDDLYASIPVHAASFEAKLKTAGELNVGMVMVGSYESDKTGVRFRDLTGSCDRATHVIVAMTTGAFEFSAGAEGHVSGGVAIGGFGAGANSDSKKEMLTRGGDPASCAKATRKDKEPPEGCGGLLRVEVVALGDTPSAATSGGTCTPFDPPGDMTDECVSAKKLFDAGKWADAEPAIRAVLRGATGDSEGNKALAEIWMGATLIKLGRNEEVIAILGPVRKNPCHPGNAEAKRLLASIGQR
jgi:hypothetical protein